MLDYTRHLIHVPILHSPGDMGQIAGQLEAAYVELFGQRRWREHRTQLEHFWQAVAAAVDALPLDLSRVDLYQDGLPLCPQELGCASVTGAPLPAPPPGGRGNRDWGPLDIVRDAAGRSENFRLLLALVGRGARLIGTEDPHLLLEEYRAIRNKKAIPTDYADYADLRKKNKSGKSAESVGNPAVQSEIRTGKPGIAPDPRPLLQRRDAFIAARIGQTLQPGRTGLLFLGLLHDIRKHLPADIVVQRLDIFGPELKGEVKNEKCKMRSAK